MPGNEEKRRSVAGIVTPNATPDADWRREVAGVYAFGDAELPELLTLSTAELNGLTTNELNGLLFPVSSGAGPFASALVATGFSPLNIPIILAARF